MVKAFRPRLEPPANRQISVSQSARPCLCVIICTGVAALIFGAFIASGLNFYANRFEKDVLVFFSGDEVAVSEVTDDFSSFFCDSYEVKIWGAGEAYLLPSKATVNTTFDGQEEFISMLQVPGFAYSERSLYLLDQSEVVLSACRENGSRQLPAEIILIQDKSNLDKWRENKKCSSCALRRVPIPAMSFCGDIITSLEQEERGINKTQPREPEKNKDVDQKFKYRTNDSTVRDATLNYKVSGNSNYFILIYYGTPGAPETDFLEPGIRLSGVVKRTSFNIKSATKECVLTGNLPYFSGKHNGNRSSNTCRFNLPYRTHLDIVVRLGQTDISSRYSIDALKPPHIHGLDVNVDIHNYLRDLNREEEEKYGDDGGAGGGIGIELSNPNRGEEGMETKCHPRLSVWICLFAVLPVALVALFSVALGLFLCMQRRRGLESIQRQQLRGKGRSTAGGKSSSKSGRRKDKGGLVEAEVLPDGAEGSMAIQG